MYSIHTLFKYVITLKATVFTGIKFKISFDANIYVYVPVNSKTLECIKTFNTNYKNSS